MTGKSHLSDLGNEERMLLCNLPYRVGIWMSHSDDESGEEDDVREMRALEKTLTALAKADNTPPFVQEILNETLSHRAHWQEWADLSFDILADCEKAVVCLEKNVSKEDRRAYKKTLIKIASQVGGAYGEFGESFQEESFFNRLLKKVKGESNADFMNISAAEEAALQRMVAALHLKDDG